MSRLLEITDLNVHFALADGDVHAVRDAGLSIDQGECLGVVGESGSGKSQLFLAAFAFWPHGRGERQREIPGRGNLGRIRRRLNALRGGAVTMIFQDPLTSLTPHMKVGAQIMEALMLHRKVPRAEAENAPAKCWIMSAFPRAPALAAYLTSFRRMPAGDDCDGHHHRPDLIIADSPPRRWM